MVTLNNFNQCLPNICTLQRTGLFIRHMVINTKIGDFLLRDFPLTLSFY